MGGSFKTMAPKFASMEVEMFGGKKDPFLFMKTKLDPIFKNPSKFDPTGTIGRSTN
jgi:hypothetical protein